MATNIITDLDSQLASLNQLKPPGASKGKISSITTLCVGNIQAESNIIQSLYRALKKAPATHKLGAIYVIDSVVRRWIESAKANGQDLNVEGRGEPGTYPAAVKRVTELMPALFEDTFKAIPSEQKEKLEGMVKIWEKGNTFPTKMLSDFRAKLSGSGNQAAVQSNGAAGSQSTAKSSGGKFSAPLPSRPLMTPVGYPPQHLYDQGLIPKKPEQAKASDPSRSTPMANGLPQYNSPPTQQQQASVAQPPSQQPAAAASSNVNSILAALANTAAQPTPQPSTTMPSFPQQNAASNLPPGLAALLQTQSAAPANSAPAPQQQMPQYSTPQGGPPFQMPPNFPQGFPGFPPPQQPPSVPQHYAPVPPPQQAPPQQQQQPDILAGLRHILPQSILNDQQKLVQALKVLQDLQSGGIPMEQWGPVIQAFDENYQSAAQTNFGNYNDYNNNKGRDRSRSPDRGRRRASPVYGTYDESRRGHDHHRGRGGEANEHRRYRQRSPIRDSPAPPPASSGGNQNVAMNGMPMQPKYITFESSLPADTIKVLSRTLFVGGANGSPQEIQNLFERFGHVQTCIANRDKRHAFVKMTTRAHALSAKQGMERLQAANDREVMNIARQTKWGVGFGPRECCDYAKGESIIPIHKLTDADMKWLLTAEYGGTGGQKLQGGMILEEPDIEIGAGVSSKAMSKRVLPTEAGGSSQGGGSNKRQRDDNHSGRGKDRGKRQGDGGGHHGYGGGNGGGGGGFQPPPMQMEAYGYPRPSPVAIATPPAVPGFGFALPGSGQPTYR